MHNGTAFKNSFSSSLSSIWINLKMEVKFLFDYFG